MPDGKVLRHAEGDCVLQSISNEKVLRSALVARRGLVDASGERAPNLPLMYTHEHETEQFGRLVHVFDGVGYWTGNLAAFRRAVRAIEGKTYGEGDTQAHAYADLCDMVPALTPGDGTEGPPCQHGWPVLSHNYRPGRSHRDES